MNKNIYIPVRDVAEDAKLNHEIAEELRKFKTNHQLSSSGLTRGSRSNKGSFANWIPVSHPQGGAGITIERKFWMPYRKGFALRGMTALFLLVCFPSFTQAEICTATPDCKTLGYTETSCPNDNGVRCPWNTSLWHCDQGCAADCEKLGYKYDCKSGGATGSSGQSCGGKYSKCICSSGSTWSGGKCVQPSHSCCDDTSLNRCPGFDRCRGSIGNGGYLCSKACPYGIMSKTCFSGGVYSNASVTCY